MTRRPAALVLLALALTACSAPTAPGSRPPIAASPSATSRPSANPGPSQSVGAGTASPGASAPALPDSPDRQHVALNFIKLPGMTDPPAGEGFQRYLDQTVAWTSCATGKGECATILAPMDYADPNGTAITLKLARNKATHPVGSLLVNPGGPGEPGTDMAFDDRWRDVRVAYDIVGWDPRGTGGSTPVVCVDHQSGPQPGIDAINNLDSSPDTQAEYLALTAAAKAFALGCAQRSGVWLRYITTDQTVQDMDLIRQVLGDAKLTFVGYSYGTFLGAVYANYFPDRVGRMVLDSAVNITEDESIVQAQGFDRALRLFADWAGRRGKVGTSTEDVLARLTAWIDGLDAQPMKVGARELTQSLAVTGVLTFLYGQEAEWGYLETGLTYAYAGNATYLLRIADFMNDRQADGSYGPRFYSFPAILCADQRDHGLAAAKAEWGQDQLKAPYFGRWFGPGTTCEQWVTPALPPVRYTAPTAAPIVIVGSTGDPATPYEYASWMAKQLGSGVEITWDGPGHGTYGSGNACIDNAVTHYLLTGVPPAKGTVCKP